jgi:WD40 repeat protein
MMLSIFLSFALLLCSNTTCLEKSTNLMPASENAEASSSNTSSNARKFVTLVLSDGLHYQVSPDDSLTLFSGLIKEKFSTHPGGTIMVPCTPITKMALNQCKKYIKAEDKKSYLSALQKTGKQVYENFIRAADHLSAGNDIIKFHVNSLWNYMVTAEGKQKLKDFCAQQNNFPLCKKMLEAKIEKYNYVVSHKQIDPFIDTHHVDTRHHDCLLEYCPEGDSLAVAVPDKVNTITIYYPSDPEKKQIIDNITAPLAFQYNPVIYNQLATTSMDGMVKIWDLEKQSNNIIWSGDRTQRCYLEQACIAYCQDGNFLARFYQKTTNDKRNFDVLDPRDRTSLPIPCNDKNITALCWGAPHSLLVGITTRENNEKGQLGVMDIRIMKYVHTFPTQDRIIKHIQQHPLYKHYIAAENYMYDYINNTHIKTVDVGVHRSGSVKFAVGGDIVKSHDVTKMSIENLSGKTLASWKHTNIKAFAVNQRKGMSDGWEIAAIAENYGTDRRTPQYGLALYKLHKINHTGQAAIEAYNKIPLD